MPAILSLILLLLLAIAAAAFWTVWGIPIAIVAVLLLVAIFVRARQKDPTLGTWERGRGVEPTGTPRKARGGAETANERVGQP